ncbi:MAG: phosphatase PAP2 family protein [Telmatospirillum sp.]|nr:phosphatase PAP2 family protein [Telmatospirillum sp.]
MVPSDILSDRRALAAGTVKIAAAGVLLILLLVLFADRPFADWSYGTLHRPQLFVWMTHIVDPVPVIAVLGLGIQAVALLCGWRPGPLGRAAIAVCLAVLVGMAVKEVLKNAVGRTWPETWTNGNPSWIRDRVFSVDPFHGGNGWASFPSGHTTVITAPMAVLWFAIPRWRILWTVPVLLVAIGLLGCDYHWPSDIVGGWLVGVAAAVGALAILRPAGDGR